MKWLGRVLLVVVLLLLGSYLFLQTPDTDPAAMRAKYGGEPSQFVDLGNGLKVHVRDEGPRGIGPVGQQDGKAVVVEQRQP